MQNHIGCICLTFLHCVFSNVSSKRLHNMMHSHIGCICLTFLHCAFSNVSSNGLHGKMHSHIGCIYVISWHCQYFSSGFSHLHPANQSSNFPLAVLCVVFCPNCCFKLSQINHWLLVSHNQKCFLFHGILSLFHKKKGKCLGGRKYIWQISCKKCHI